LHVLVDANAKKLSVKKLGQLKICLEVLFQKTSFSMLGVTFAAASSVNEKIENQLATILMLLNHTNSYNIKILLLITK